jgi:hypothetical protein
MVTPIADESSKLLQATIHQLNLKRGLCIQIIENGHEALNLIIPPLFRYDNNFVYYRIG